MPKLGLWEGLDRQELRGSMNAKTQYCETCDTQTEWWDVNDKWECVRCKTQ